MANSLTTRFIYNDADNAKIFGTKTLLTETNDLFNRLGKNTDFGKTLNENFGLATKGADSLKRKTEDLAKPTFGGEYLEQSKKINDAFKSNEAAADSFAKKRDEVFKSTKGLPDAGANSLKEIDKFSKDSSGKTTKGSFGTPNTDLLETVEKTRLAVQKLNGQQLDGKNFGGLTQAGVRLQTELGRVSTDISRLNTALSKTNNKNIIKILNEDLVVAENKFNSLNRRVSQYEGVTSQPGSRGGGSGANNLKLSGFQKTNLSYQINDVVTGLASGQNPTQILAQQGGQIAQIFNPTQITAFTAAYSGLVAVLGAGAIAIALTYKITGDIRADAERQLAVQTKITGELNKQRLAAKDLERDFAEQRANAARADAFSRSVQGDTLEQLTRRRQGLEQSIKQTRELKPLLLNTSNNPEQIRKLDNDDARDRAELLDIERRLREIPFEKSKSANDIFNQQSANFQKSQSDRLASELRFADKLAEYNKKRKDEAKRLVEDFGNTLISLKLVDNPLVRQLSDFETAADRARLKFGAFGDSVVDKIAAIERANLTKAINLQQLQNQSDALKLNQDARRLEAAPERSFASFQRSLELVEKKADFVLKINGLNRQIDEANFYANQYNPNNPKSYAEFNRRGGRDDISDVGLQIKDAVSDIRDLSSLSTSDVGIYGKGAIADKILSAIPNREELLKRLNSPFGDIRGNADFLLQAQANASTVKRDFEQQKFKDFIEDQKTAEFGKTFAREQIGLINGSKLTDIEKAKQRLSVTNSLGNDLDSGLRRQAIEDSIFAGRAKLNENTEALRAATETRDAVQAIVKALAGQGIKIDGSNLPPSVVNVKVETDKGTQEQSFLAKRPQGGAMTDDYRIGDSRDAGDLYGATITQR